MAVSPPQAPYKRAAWDQIGLVAQPWLGDWLAELYDQWAVTFEQRIPGWDKTTEQGIKQAILDVVLAYPGGRVCLDVSVAEALASPSDAWGARARARVPGAAARQRELRKHTCYPGPGLCAAVLESGGRMGNELRAFLRAHAPAECGRTRAEALADVKQRLVVAVARGHAACSQRPRGARRTRAAQARRR